MLKNNELTKEDLNDRLTELSSLPGESLQEMGYNEEQISIIKSYEEGEDAFTHLYGGRSIDAGATLTFRYGIAGTDNTKKTVCIAYESIWSGLPMATYTDSFAIAWTAADASSHSIETKIDEESTIIGYYPVTGGNKHTTETIVPEVTHNSLAANIPMLSGVQYAKGFNGLISVSTQSESYNMQSIQVYFAYAQMYKKWELGDSIGISVVPAGVSFNLVHATHQRWIISPFGHTFQARDYNGNLVYEEIYDQP